MDALDVPLEIFTDFLASSSSLGEVGLFVFIWWIFSVNAKRFLFIAEYGALESI